MIGTCGLVVFLDMNTDVLKDTNLKTFLKEIYVIVLLLIY